MRLRTDQQLDVVVVPFGAGCRRRLRQIRRHPLAGVFRPDGRLPRRARRRRFRRSGRRLRSRRGVAGGGRRRTRVGGHFRRRRRRHAGPRTLRLLSVKKKNKQKQPGNGRWKLGNGKKTMVGAGTPSKEAAWPSGCWCDRRRRRRPTRSCGRRPKRRTVGGGPRPSSTGAASVRFQSRLIRFRASGGHGIDPISESEKGRNRSTTLVWTSSDLVQNSATRRRQRCHEEIPFPYKEMKTTLTNHEHRLNDTAPDWLPTGRAT